MSPKKRFGQNFLTNKSFAHKIVDALQLSDTDSIVEIGPGKGVLTQIINEIPCNKRIAIEIDTDLIADLQTTFNNVEILHQDILSFSFAKIFDRTNNKIKVVGNIPYNITSPILFHLLENSTYISEAVLMMQQEVANRLIAGTGTKDYGILTVLTGAQANIQKLFNVNRSNFYPQPKVDSTVIKISFVRDSSAILNYELFKKIVKTTFNNRRKMLRNTLNKITESENIAKIETVQLDKRPENLTIDDFLKLTNEIVQLR